MRGVASDGVDAFSRARRLGGRLVRIVQRFNPLTFPHGAADGVLKAPVQLARVPSTARPGRVDRLSGFLDVRHVRVLRHQPHAGGPLRAHVLVGDRHLEQHASYEAQAVVRPIQPPDQCLVEVESDRTHMLLRQRRLERAQRRHSAQLVRDAQPRAPVIRRLGAGPQFDRPDRRGPAPPTSRSSLPRLESSASR